MAPAKQCWACDSELFIQTWLKTKASCPVFKDLAHVAKTCAFDVQTGEHKVVASRDLDATGWMCTAVSISSSSRNSHAQCIRDRTAASGKTFGYWIDSLAAHPVVGAMGENIHALVGGAGAAAIQPFSGNPTV